MMEKEFVTYQIALDMKSIGFDEPCLRTWDELGEKLINDLTPKYKKGTKIFAPLKQQVFSWFREKHNLHYRITYYDPIKAQELNHADYQGGIYASAASWFDGSLYIPHNSYWKLENSPYDTYQEAELECLKKLIEIVKEK